MKKSTALLAIISLAFLMGAVSRFDLTSQVSAKAYTVATLPGSPLTGMLAIVTDGNGNSCTSGSGSTLEICYYNGSSWSSIAVGSVLAVNTVADTSTPVTVSTTLNAEYHFNQNATVGTGITYNLPTAALGKQFCFSNSYNGSAADTGVLTIATSASGQFIIFTDGTLSATGGNITSGGAAADAACVTGVDTTHWMLYVNRGTWTKH